jgi:flagellar motor switch protein FliM
VLDTVLYRWARGIEEGLFAELRLEAYVGASVVEEMRFTDFFRSLKRARPIYAFALHPFPGQGLLVLDNRFANLCLYGSVQGAGEREGGADRVRLTPENQERLQRVVQTMMERFDAAWADVHPVRTQLRKVTTYLFRARIFNAYEPCLVAQLHLSGEHLSARLLLCLPKFMLAPVLERLQQVHVVPSLAQHAAPLVPPERLLGPASYEVGASVGTLSATLGPDRFRVGSVFPLTSPAGGEVLLDVNGTPLLVGEVGESNGRYAVRVTGTYPPAAPAASPPSAPFQPIRWPLA